MRKQLKNLVYLGSIFSVNSILQRALSFLFVPIYTSYLTPEDYGVIGLMSVAIAWIQKFVGPPVLNGIVRYYYAPECRDQRKEQLFSASAFVFLQAVVLAALFFLASRPLSGLILGDLSLERITRAYAFVLLVQPIGTVWSTVLRMQGRAKFLTSISFCRFLLSALLQIYLLVWRDMGVMAVVYAGIFAAWFDVVTVGPYMLKQVRFKFEWRLLRSILHYGYPLIVAALVGAFASSADRVVLRIYGTLSIVGMYAFGQSLVSVVDMLLTVPFKGAFPPVVFRMEKDPKRLRDFVKRSCTYVYMAALMLCLLVSVFAKDVIVILARNPEFWGAWTVVPFLTFARVHRTIGSYFGNGIVMAKKSALMSATSVVILVINIAFLMVLIPMIGLLGAALAALITVVARNVIWAYYSRKYYNQEFEVARLLKITGIGGAVFVVALVVILLDLPIWIGIPLRMATIALYPLLLWITRVFDETERSKIRALVKRYRSRGALEVAQGVASIYRR
jgi:O-antigen/teichoic acid export membrane protein